MKKLKQEKERLYAALSMLIICSVLLVQASYAWLTLSNAPEVTSVGNTAVANGSLEIALLNDVTSVDLSKITSGVGSSKDVTDVTIANESWGNLVDLKDSSYGLNKIILLPARLNLSSETEIEEEILQTVTYGKDGRATETLENTTTASYSSNNAFDSKGIGVQAIGIGEQALVNGEYVPTVENTYGYIMNFVVRTNVEDAKLLLQTDAVDRVYSDGAGLTMGNGSCMQLISNNPTEMTEEQMKNLLSAVRVVFVQPETEGYTVYAIGAFDMDMATVSTTISINDTVKAPLYLYDYSKSEYGGVQVENKKNNGEIVSLKKNAAQKISVIVYLDGDMVSNAMVDYASTKSMSGALNLQFATDVALIPASNTELHNSTGTDEIIISGTYGTNNTVTFKQKIDKINHVITLEEYTGTAGYITIPGMVSIEGETYSVKVNSGLFYKNDTIRAVKFAEANGKKVTSGDKSAYQMFYGCTNLMNVDFSGFDTSEVTSMYCMFSECSNLKSINTEYLETGNVTNMQSMFAWCSSLTQLDLSNFDTSNVTNMSSMFFGANMLNSLNLTSFDTSSVTDMSGMFGSGGGSQISHLQQIDVSSFDTSSVIDMEGMFGACNNLISLDLSNFDTSNVTDMNAMFYACSKLESLNISSFDTSKVTRFTNMFASCSKLKSLDLSSFDTTSAVSAGAMFGGNYALTSIVTPKAVGTAEMNLEKTFYNNGIAYTTLNSAPANVVLVSTE